MSYVRLNPVPRSLTLEHGSTITDYNNGNVHIKTALVNNKWVDYSFEQDGLWMRVYNGSGTSDPAGNWKRIASW